jgi:hypothetical protein
VLRNPFNRFLGLSLTLFLVACAAYREQHGSPAAGGSSAAAPAAIRPGAEFSGLTEDQQIARIRGEVEEVKTDLHQQGRYECCVEPACTECLLKFGECHCREAVRQEGPCCGECTEAWIEGRGTVEGVTAWELLERRKNVLDEVNKKKGGGGEQKPEPPHHHH